MSSTSITSATTTRKSLGPLTTTFTPPQECSIFGGIGSSKGFKGLWAAQGCKTGTIFDTATCWPPAASSIALPGPPFLGLGFYSPGLICPSGYATACTSAQLSNGVPSPILSGNSFSFEYALEAGETAIGCCPSGFSCHIGGSIQTCVSAISSTAFQIGLCGRSAYDTLYSIAIPGEFAYTDSSGSTWTTSAPATTTLMAPLFQLNWQSSDLSPAATSTSLSQNTLTSASLQSSQPPAISSSSVIPEPAITPIPAPSDPGLSSGAKIAIGVAVPLGVLALIFLIAFSWFRMKRIRQSTPMSIQPEEQASEKKNYGVYQGTAFAPATEVQGSDPAHVLMHELKGTEVLPSEKA